MTFEPFRPRPAVWVTTYPLGGPQHCWWKPALSQWTTIKDGRTQECRDWRKHPHARGKTGFLRFIHALPDQLTDLADPFLGTLWICHEGMMTQRGKLVYCEVYLETSEEHGARPIYKVFLDREDCLATIECFDDRYLEPSRMAAASVDQSYIDEENAS
jgi:hypothetical protein